ncbi:SnoaL-like domain protein (plasmid) [Variovorax sp. SRS16]|uniref:nuclear transport factor 2 family protein n=1 Tax=Variovorax sp. SRS16 TaxID=282217 RepID=UPI001316BF4B|nr:nuclear transport factor 2 family protein [Variovorax sp. SRS16]VTU45816.1 SnoaL-like domain protein [Variovorax sp. SRS16]
MIDAPHCGLSDAQVATVQTACASVLACYCHCADSRDHAAFAELFAPDGVWKRPGMVMRGRDEIRRFMDARPTGHVTRHVCGSIHVEVIDQDHARGLSYTTVYRDPAYGGTGPAKLVQPQMVVDYRDEFVRIDGRWHIGARHTTVVFSDQA